MPAQSRMLYRAVIFSAALILFSSASFIMPARTGATSPAATFNRDVAPILYGHCVKCHREGEIAARVPLTSYDSAKPFAEKMKEMVVTRRMPPWPADPAHSLKFRNDARLSQSDIDKIDSWVSGGAAKGDDADLPPFPKLEDGWMHPQGRKPDLVVSLPGLVHLPPAGSIPYARWLVKVPFAEDKWVVASQTRPGNAAVVHHMAITEIALNEGTTAQEVEQLAGVAKQLGAPNALVGAHPAVQSPGTAAGFDMLGMYAPGTTFEAYGADTAKLLKGGKNMFLNFNMHYQTTGKPETDKSMLALWFEAKPPRYELFRVPTPAETIIANGTELMSDKPGVKAEGTDVVIPPIPPNAARYELTGIMGITAPLTIYQFQPHAHHRAVDFRYSVVYPDGHEQTLLSVPKYDHRWQMAYELETQLKLPAGSKLIVTAHYDNSSKNMHNPDPEKAVYFRDQNQSWDEMFSPFIQFAIERPAGESKRKESAVVAVVGCLEPDGKDGWSVRNAEQSVSKAQSTTAAEIDAAKAKPPGKLNVQLLGVEVFNPSNLRGQRVAAKGILIDAEKLTRVNVTSLQSLGASCAR